MRPERWHMSRRDDGVTLPELLVTVFLLSIVTTLIVSFMSSVSRTFSQDTAATDSINVATTGMNEMTRVIRSGTEVRLVGATVNSPVFITAKPNEVVLYAYIDTSSTKPQPLKVRFSIDSSRRIVETRWLATTVTGPWAFASTPDTTRTIARAVPTSAPAMFEYLDKDGNVLPLTASGLTAAQLKEVAAVTITLTIQADVTARAEPVTLRNSVGIPNLGISRIGPTT